MKTELRVGNYVSDVHSATGMWMVISLGESRVKYGNFKPNIYSAKYDHLRPIPLTHEILEKCGFEWSIYHQAFHKHEDGHEVYDLNECYPKGYQFSTFKKGHLVGRPIFYLHQLQNFVHAITGEELEVKL